MKTFDENDRRFKGKIHVEGPSESDFEEDLEIQKALALVSELP